MNAGRKDGCARHTGEQQRTRNHKNSPSGRPVNVDRGLSGGPVKTDGLGMVWTVSGPPPAAYQ